MSEITKACERPSCDNGKRYTLNANGIITAAVDCGDCSGTGRVPDVEGQLRAEVARLTADLSILAWERDSWKGNYERVIDPHNRAIVGLTAEVARLTATLAERDGEVERMEGRVQSAANMLREGQWNGRGAFWYGPCCPNCGGTERTGHYANCARAAWLAGCKS